MSRTLSVFRQPTFWAGAANALGHAAWQNRDQLSGMAMRSGRRLKNYVSKRYPGRTRSTARASSGRAPSTASYQADAVVIAGSRRRSGRTKRRARQFKRFRARVRNAMSSDVPNSMTLRQSWRRIDLPASAIDDDPNGQQSANYMGFGDNAIISQAFDDSILSRAVGSEDTIRFRSCACELQISAVGQCYVDVYEVVARKDISVAQNADVSAQWSDSFNQLANGGGAPTTNSWGVTPYDAPAFCKMWKIIRVSRLAFLHENGETNPAGNVVIERTMKFRNMPVQGNRIANTRFIKGARAFLFVVKGVPVQLEEGAGDMSGATVSIRYNQTLHYEVFSPDQAYRSMHPDP